MKTAILNAQPWRFHQGQHVFVRGWPQQDPPAVITALVKNRAFPHYFLVDGDGHEWLIAQLHLSSKPIPNSES